jgi:YggT family protein
MRSLYYLIDTVLNMYTWIIIASVIMSWLVAFNVINTHNRIVGTIGEVLYRLTEPVLGQIRRYVPSVGGLDLSPIVLLLGIYFVRMLLAEYWPA